MKKFLPNILEYAAIIFLGELILILEEHQAMSKEMIFILIVVICWVKTAWFSIETSHQLVSATRKNMPYHRFLYIMGINMTQIVISFAIDYYALIRLDINSFNGINPNFSQPELLFECLYFSLLNFSFFGYGDITPNIVPSKIVTITEIVLAFSTVIFILSDFITLKESISTSRFVKKEE
jgi:Ion channel